MHELTIKQLSAGYAGNIVLFNINITLATGEILSLVGPNGSGKTTLIRCLSGVITPVAGMILRNKLDLSTTTPNQRARIIATVPQAINLPLDYTVMEIVAMGRHPHLSAWKSEQQHDYEHISTSLEQVSMTSLAHKKIGELSGGQRQRVAIAKALSQEPEIILLDEATAHLDLKNQAKILYLLKQLVEDHSISIISATHDLNLSGQFSDRIALLAEGHIHSIGSPEEILTEDNLKQIYDIDLLTFTHPTNKQPLIFFDTNLE